MALVLTWENPLDLATPRAVSARLLRAPPNSQAPSTVVATDITWGVTEDQESSDPNSVYQVEYLGRDGNPTVIVSDAAIDRFVRPGDTCKVTFAATFPNGAPYSGRWVEVTEPQGTSYLQRFLCNRNGICQFFLQYGRRVLIRTEGSLLALDCVAPAIADITYADLRKYGSFVDSDRRGWY